MAGCLLGSSFFPLFGGTPSFFLSFEPRVFSSPSFPPLHFLFFSLLQFLTIGMIGLFFPPFSSLRHAFSFLPLYGCDGNGMNIPLDSFLLEAFYLPLFFFPVSIKTRPARRGPVSFSFLSISVLAFLLLCLPPLPEANSKRSFRPLPFPSFPPPLVSLFFPFEQRE